MHLRRIGNASKDTMTFVRSSWWLPILLAFAVGGAGMGLGLPAMKRFAATHYGRQGLAVFFVINIAMPLLVISLSALHPRYRVALGGTLLATLLFLLCAGLRPASLNLSAPASMIRSMGPIVFVACVMYHILAAGTVSLVNLKCRVGTPPDPLACVQCGYKLIGLAEPRCPECFARITSGTWDSIRRQTAD
jgi:hypothetical protein